ncbi:MAG: hypothetical protein Q8L55_12360 [Phycisphaerales bacterium]|nr:hypothetical protein [Phycisphaerales bacterium]
MGKAAKRALGAVQTLALAVVAIAGLVTLTIANLPRSASTSTNTANTRGQLVLTAGSYLDVVGLSPDALAAAGVTAEQAGVVFANLQAHLSGDGSGLQDAIDAWGVANRDADMARRSVRAGKGTVEDMNAKDGTLAAALAAKQSAINNATAAAASQLDNNVIETLARIKANRPQNVPVQYLVVDRTGEQWRQLRDALSQKKQRDTFGAQLDPDAATIIADANSDPAVFTAATNVANNLASVQQAMR